MQKSVNPLWRSDPGSARGTRAGSHKRRGSARQDSRCEGPRTADRPVVSPAQAWRTSPHRQRARKQRRRLCRAPRRERESTVGKRDPPCHAPPPAEDRPETRYRGGSQSRGSNAIAAPVANQTIDRRESVRCQPKSHQESAKVPAGSPAAEVLLDDARKGIAFPLVPRQRLVSLEVDRDRLYSHALIMHLSVPPGQVVVSRPWEDGARTAEAPGAGEKRVS